MNVRNIIIGVVILGIIIFFLLKGCLTNTSRMESFKSYLYKGITQIETSDRRSSEGVFQFAIAIDLSDVIVSDSYKLNPDNYEVSRPFMIKNVHDTLTASKIHPSDLKRIKKWATHVVILHCTDCKNINTIDNISLALKRHLPDWIENSTVMDDTNPDNISGKTFGLSYLIGGVNDAFKLKHPESDTYFNIKISVKHE